MTHRRILHKKEALTLSAATLPKTLIYTLKKVFLVYKDSSKTLSLQQHARKKTRPMKANGHA